jgi:hypothetical protein
MLDPIEQRSQSIDNDKRAVELAALALLLPVFDTAQQHAEAAIRIGADPAQAAESVIVGNERTQQPGIVKPLIFAAIAAWLMGYWRTQATHIAYTSNRPVSVRAIRRAITQARDPLNPPRGASETVNAIVDMAGREKALRIAAEAEERARRQARQLSQRIAERFRESGRPIGPIPDAFELRMKDGAHLPDAIEQAMKDARLTFRRMGLDRNHAFLIETVTEATVARQYEQGRSDAGQTPAIAPALWGWTWSAVIDGHQCPKCNKLHKMQAPTDHPVWRQFGPQLHFGCRCSKIEIYRTSEQPEPQPNIPTLSDAEIVENAKTRAALEKWWQGF